jgi:CelD/BcsL family acetyltransferase involved in cellulose biosynthesis
MRENAHGSDGVEWVTSLPRLLAIEPLLEDLLHRDPHATPFQSPAWLVPWLQHLGAQASLRWLVVHADGRAVLSLPLQIDARTGERCLRWVGHGISDRLDAVVDPAIQTDALDGARQALQDLWHEVGSMDLDELPCGAPERAFWRGLTGSRFEPGCVCPVLPLGADAPALEQRLPRWLRRNVQQTERRLRARGRLEWRVAEAANVSELLEGFMQLHAARWSARGEPGVLADADVRAFHRAAAPRLLSRGLLELELLFLDDRPLAATYVLRRCDAHLYLFGFDPSDARLSLGSLAICRSIQRAAEAGAGCYDFLRGCEPYKYAFGAQNRQSHRCIVSGTAQAARADRPGNCPRTSCA